MLFNAQSTAKVISGKEGEEDGFVIATCGMSLCQIEILLPQTSVTVNNSTLHYMHAIMTNNNHIRLSCNRRRRIRRRRRRKRRRRRRTTTTTTTTRPPLSTTIITTTRI